MKSKRIGLIVWVSFWWVVAVAILGILNYALFRAMYEVTPLWAWLTVCVTLSIVFAWSAFDALMSFTYDMLYPGMDEER